ncbi:MAG: alpha-L-fucosidase [Candidatus Omnitrophota bacterium]
MNRKPIDRRAFLSRSFTCAAAGALSGWPSAARAAAEESEKRGAQRLSLEALKKWESLGYGMFIHFGMSTFVNDELPDGKADAKSYAPDKLDVDQWISVARDAGMKYAVLTTKHVAGHCLWPTKCTDYNVSNSGDKTDVVEQFVKACDKRGVLPGFYYCSWDNHNRFGSQTPSDGGWNGMNSFPKSHTEKLPPFTTSLYQNFLTAQITELLTTYGPIMELWIDIPGVLGRGYRTFLYHYAAQLQPEIVIMMNSGISDGSTYDVDYAWPSDLIAIERQMPPASGHKKWRTIEGKGYYMPGELCDPIGKNWFYVLGDKPRADEDLLLQFETCRERGANVLLDVPPDGHGLIPPSSVEALMRLRKGARL